MNADTLTPDTLTALRTSAATAMHRASMKLTEAINHPDYSSADSEARALYRRRVGYRADLYRLACERYDKVCALSVA